VGIRVNAFGHGSSLNFRMVDADCVVHCLTVAVTHISAAAAGAYYATAIRVTATGSTARRAIVRVLTQVEALALAGSRVVLLGGLIERPAMPKDVSLIIVVSLCSNIQLIDLFPQVPFNVVHGSDGVNLTDAGRSGVDLASLALLLRVSAAWRLAPPPLGTKITVRNRSMIIAMVIAKMVINIASGAALAACETGSTVDERAVVF
jgi:hypothetical protein